MDRITLTGALCASRQVVDWTHKSQGPCEEGYQPFTGDLRLSIRIDPAVYVLPEGHQRCRGVCILHIFNGTSWQRFDGTSLTTVLRFESPEQLAGVECWLRHALAQQSGKACASRKGAFGEWFALSATSHHPSPPASMP